MYKKFVKFVYALKFKMNARRFANKIRRAMVELSDCGFSDGINGRMPNIPGLTKRSYPCTRLGKKCTRMATVSVRK